METFGVPASMIADALVSRIEEDPSDAQMEEITKAVVMGMGFAAAEYAAGWQKHGRVDSVIHTAMCTLALDFFKDKSDRYSRFKDYCIHAGYWAQRVGEAGLAQLMQRHGSALKEMILGRGEQNGEYNGR